MKYLLKQSIFYLTVLVYLIRIQFSNVKYFEIHIGKFVVLFWTLKKDITEYLKHNWLNFRYRLEENY